MNTTLSQREAEAAGTPRAGRPKLVIALGGNALLQRGETASADVQRQHAAEAIAQVARLADEYELVLTHGNGPQVGLLALQSLAYTDVPPYPLDVLGAESEGMIGYVLELELENRLPGRPIATLLTQVIVDENDPGFQDPTKFVGPVYDKETAEKLAAERGWTIKPDGKYFRRVVPSPEPKGIVEIKSIRHLVEFGAIVICSGGGGIPVVRDPDYILRGVEAVIDKDLAGELLAELLGADVFLMLTDVPAVEIGWGTPQAHTLHATTAAELRRHAFAPGSMGPKVEAACRFVERTGGTAAIGALEDAVEIVAGRAGTLVKPSLY